jgi:hypothetical protein
LLPLRAGFFGRAATEFPVIAIGASAGALDAVRCITEALPRDRAAAIVVVFHVGAIPSQLSAAATFGTRVVGVVLGGRREDGAIGLRKIKDYGGLALVHDPEEALVPQMPAAAVVAAVNAEVLRIERLARRVAQFCAGTGAAMSTATERLARRLVAGVARTSTIQWVKLQDVEQRLGIDRASAQAAMRVAIDRGWVIAEEPWPSACRLTDAGRALPRPR